MVERRLEFERLDARDLCATIGIAAEAEQVAEDRWIIPVTIDDSTGVRAAEVRLRYDSHAWTVEPSSIKTGSAWKQGSATLAKVDAEAGEITVFMFATEELAGEQGNLLHVELTPQDAATTAGAPLEVESVRLNEGAIEAAVSSDADEDYINPRVRAKHNLQPPAPVLASQIPTSEPASASTAETTFTLWREVNQTMGPQPLLKRFRAIAEPIHKQAIARVEPDPVTGSGSTIDRWLLLLADDEARVRRRAA